MASALATEQSASHYYGRYLGGLITVSPPAVRPQLAAGGANTDKEPAKRHERLSFDP